MTIPPSKLWTRLWQCEAIDLRKVDNSFEANISGTDARAYALAGLVEGIATPSGRIRYVRRLEHVAVATMPVKANEEQYNSTSTAFCRPNMGAVQEPVKQVIVALDHDDKRVVVGEGDQVGYVYSLVPQPPAGWRTCVLAPTICAA